MIWTKAQFFALCRHMLNDNDPSYFLIPYRKDEGGAAYFAKAKTARADRRTNWAWDTITGHAKIPASIGFYPRTPDGKSRWAAMDFDAHDGEAACARDWALDAFRVLFLHPELFLVLCTSGGGGWHLFVLSREFYAVEDWNRLLKQAAEFIGATVGAGLCEIFPSETRGTTGYGIASRRVESEEPASWADCLSERSPTAASGREREYGPFYIGQLTVQKALSLPIGKKRVFIGD